MEKNVKKVSLFRIVQSDGTAGMAVIMMIVPLAMYLILVYYGKIPGLRGHDPLTASDAPSFLNLTFVAALLGIPLLAWRIRFFNSLFARADEVTGQITNIKFYRDRGLLNTNIPTKTENI